MMKNIQTIEMIHLKARQKSLKLLKNTNDYYDYE